MSKAEYRKLLNEVAKIHGVNVSVVRKEIDFTIRFIFENSNAAAQIILKKENIPTAEEFLEHYRQQYINLYGKI
jgi:hypothetical protein